MKPVIRALIGAVFVAGAALAMVFSCPDEDNFERWAEGVRSARDGVGDGEGEGQGLSTEAKWTPTIKVHASGPRSTLIRAPRSRFGRDRRNVVSREREPDL